MPTVYYLRHGQTEWNAAGRLQGRHDSPLNGAGEAHALRCAAILAELFARDGRRPDAFDYVASPLGRARRTMQLVRGALGLEPDDFATDGRLSEISFGAWEGLTLADVRAKAPAQLAAREHDKWGFLPPGGESYAQLAMRMGEWHAALQRDTVVAAHGGTARALLAHLGILPPDSAPLADIDQGVVYVISERSYARYG